ncbi:MAG: ATP-binding protein, partial [Oscillospiraceae bacterium]
IQKIRLEDRLVIRVDVTPECMEWEIPKLSLQPIVENSIKAGAERSMKACNIIVKARIIHNRLVVSIYDNGCGISKERLAIIRNSNCANGNSIGLENIRQRVQALCKDGGDMRIYSKLGAGTVVKLIIPKRRETFDDL